MATTPPSTAIFKEVTPLPLTPGVDGNRSPPSPHGSTNLGYFLRLGKTIFNGGLGKDSHPMSRGRVHTSLLEKAQSQAHKYLNEGKQQSIEWEIRAVHAQKKGHR